MKLKSSLEFPYLPYIDASFSDFINRHHDTFEGKCLLVSSGIDMLDLDLCLDVISKTELPAFSIAPPIDHIGRLSGLRDDSFYITPSALSICRIRNFLYFYYNQDNGRLLAHRE